MEIFEIKTVEINEAVKKLNKLQAKCEKQKNKERPTNGQDCGKTHAQLDASYKTLQASWDQLIKLIGKTSGYMADFSKCYDQSDTEGADKLRQVSLYNSVADRDFGDFCKGNLELIQELRGRGKSDTEIQSYFDAGGKESVERWARVLRFTPRTEPPTADNPYYGGFYQANCVTYARCRASEILATMYPDSTTRPQISFSGDAKYFWTTRGDFSVSENVNEPRIGAIMVWGANGNYSGPGHVAVVEDVIYDANGNVSKIKYSESSWGGVWYANCGAGTTSSTGIYNADGNSISSWGSVIQTPEQIKHVTQDWNGQNREMGFTGYIYLD